MGVLIRLDYNAEHFEAFLKKEKREYSIRGGDIFEVIINNEADAFYLGMCWNEYLLGIVDKDLAKKYEDG